MSDTTPAPGRHPHCHEGTAVPEVCDGRCGAGVCADCQRELERLTAIAIGVDEERGRELAIEAFWE